MTPQDCQWCSSGAPPERCLACAAARAAELFSDDQLTLFDPAVAA